MSQDSENRLDRARPRMFLALRAVAHDPTNEALVVEFERAVREWESAFTDHVTVILNADAARDRQRDKRLDVLDDRVLGGRRGVPPGASDPDDPTGRG